MPAVISEVDPSPIELGLKFRTNVNGFITGVRFYKGPTNTGTHVGNLWTKTGTLLASVAFSGETASGWQQMSFANPPAVTANTTYIISYHTNSGNYSVNESAFATAGVQNGPLTALANGVDGPNGVFLYGAGGFPTGSFNASNYWVDVVFNTTAVDTTPPTVSSVSPTSGAVGVSTAANVTTTFSEPMDPATISTSTIELRNPSNVLVPAAVTYDGPTRTATLVPTAALAFSTTYTLTVKGGATDPRVKDVAGNALAANFTSSFTTAASTACPCTIWSSSTTPATASASDPSAIELGVKFQSSVAGFITGVRFYKGPTNTGTHTGKLWSASGTLLASATFTGETATGWQQINFATPVAIAANTTYVGSYHTTAGNYANNGAYFTADVVNGPLRALASGTSGGNGVYLYGAGGFPTGTFNASNYWVDVVFTP